MIGYKGWYHGFEGHVVEAEHRLRSVAGETWRTFKKRSVPTPEATPLPKERPPTAEEAHPAAPKPSPRDVVAVEDDGPRQTAAARHVWTRHGRLSRSAASRSGWQTIQIISRPAASPTEDVAASPTPEVPAQAPAAAPDDVLPLPEPEPSVAAPDPAPAQQ